MNRFTQAISCVEQAPKVRIFVAACLLSINLRAFGEPTPLVLRTSGDRVQSVDISPGGNYAVSTGHTDDRIVLWDLLAGTALTDFPSSGTRHMTFDSSGQNILFLACPQPNLYRYDLAGQTIAPMFHFQTPNNTCTEAALRPGCGKALLGAEPNTYLSSLADGSVLLQVADPIPNFYFSFEFALSPDCSHAILVDQIITDQDNPYPVGRLFIWDLVNNTEIGRITPQNSKNNQVAFSPDGTLFASASGGKYLNPKISMTEFQNCTDNSLEIWRVTPLERVWRFDTNGEGVYPIDFSPDGRYVAAGVGQIVRVFDISNGDWQYDYTEHSAKITALRWSPTGNGILSGDDSGAIRFWQPNENPNP